MSSIMNNIAKKLEKKLNYMDRNQENNNTKRLQNWRTVRHPG